MTFNYINTATNYQSGNELHLEWDVNEHFASGFSLGVGGYVYDQVTGDGGSGDRIGPFEGRVVAVGPLVGYTFKFMEIIPVQLNARWFHEFDVRKCVTGDSIFGTISVPLLKHQPAGSTHSEILIIDLALVDRSCRPGTEFKSALQIRHRAVVPT